MKAKLLNHQAKRIKLNRTKMIKRKVKKKTTSLNSKLMRFLEMITKAKKSKDSRTSQLSMKTKMKKKRQKTSQKPVKLQELLLLMLAHKKTMMKIFSLLNKP